VLFESSPSSSLLSHSSSLLNPNYFSCLVNASNLKANSKSRTPLIDRQPRRLIRPSHIIQNLLGIIRTSSQTSRQSQQRADDFKEEGFAYTGGL
jgi:hypothetical protein